jgi:hypothetical protein
MKELLLIQSELKAPKNQTNAFGKYNYRSCEDILEAVKPLLKKHDCVMTISDEVKSAGDYVYIESTVVFQNKGGDTVAVKAQAGIEKAGGMALPQAFGSASSYSRKYACNGLYLIDDTKDADATNTHEKKPSKPVVKLTAQQNARIRDLLDELKMEESAIEAVYNKTITALSGDEAKGAIKRLETKLNKKDK